MGYSRSGRSVPGRCLPLGLSQRARPRLSALSVGDVLVLSIPEGEGVWPDGVYADGHLFTRSESKWALAGMDR